jgi:hypothetical protein
MANVTYYVVVPFEHDDEGVFTILDPIEARSADSARFKARLLADAGKGGVAFSRLGTLTSGTTAREGYWWPWGACLGIWMSICPDKGESFAPLSLEQSAFRQKRFFALTRCFDASLRFMVIPSNRKTL